MMKYLCLNVIEDYNHHMNSTDIADQLCGSYQPDGWMRQRKWWWAFFIWGIGVAGVNTYKIYKTIYEEEVAKKTPNLPPKWTHARFLEELVYDFFSPAAPVQSHRRILPQRGCQIVCFPCHIVMGMVKMYGRKDYCRNIKPKKITKTALEGGKFSHRLDGMRHNSIQARKSDHCQYCYYQYMNDVPESNREDYPELKQNRQGIR